MDLVNQLESESRGGQQGRIAARLARTDFVVLDDNPLTCAEDRIKDLAVELTVVDGQPVGSQTP